MTTTLWIGLVVLAAFSASVQSALGFGQSLLLAPALFAAFAPTTAIVASLVSATAVNGLVLAGERRRPDPDLQLIARLVVGAVPGVFAGSVLLTVLPRSVLQVVVGVVIASAVALRLKAERVAAARPRTRFGDVGAGAAAGVLNSTTSLSGPPLVLRLSRHGLGTARLRDTLTATLLVLNALALLVIAATHAMPALAHGASIATALMPGIVLGHRLGRAAFIRMTAPQLQTSMLGAVLLAAVVSVAAGVLH